VWVSVAGVWLLYGNQLDVARAERLGERASTLARRGNDEWASLHALDALKFVALIVADIDRLEELTAELAVALRSQDARWYLQWTLVESAFASIARHRFPEAATRIDEALAISKRIGDAFSRGCCSRPRARQHSGWTRPPAARLALRIALAQLTPAGPGAGDHVAAAHGLIEQIAVSVGNAQLAEEFGRVAGAELESQAWSLGYPAADARRVTS
jgi:hypothetical protein